MIFVERVEALGAPLLPPPTAPAAPAFASPGELTFMPSFASPVATPMSPRSFTPMPLPGIQSGRSRRR
jgi:hypothetical protein